MQDLNDLYYFVQVVDYKGFAPAGRALGITKSKLSRSTRHFSVTAIGQANYQHCTAMLVEAEAAQSDTPFMTESPMHDFESTITIRLSQLMTS